MKKQPAQVVFVVADPMQNPVPLGILNREESIDILVAYCSLPDSKLWQGLEYINKSVFDSQILDGYKWQALRNFSPLKRLGSFFGLINPALIGLVRKSDCCVVFGHSYASFWIAIITARICRIKLLLTTDATRLEPEHGGQLKTKIKKIFLPWLYNKVAQGVLVPSTASKQFICSLGVSANRVFITPYVVDNEGIAKIALETNRSKVRSEWRIPYDALVVIFCGKLIPRKRPADLLMAFSKVNNSNAYLVIVGDGPLYYSLVAEAKRLGVIERVKFLGLVKYSELPATYVSSDLLVHPADREPYGLIVNEAMICGLPVIVSDRVGAGYDLIQEGVTGFTYPVGDVDSLTDRLNRLLDNKDLIKTMGKAASARMESWSPKENASETARAIRETLNSVSC